MRVLIDSPSSDRPTNRFLAESASLADSKGQGRYPRPQSAPSSEIFKPVPLWFSLPLALAMLSLGFYSLWFLAALIWNGVGF